MKPKTRPRLSPKKPNLLLGLFDLRYFSLTGRYDPAIMRKIKKKLSEST